MITKKNYIEMIGHVSKINSVGHLLTQEVKNLTPSVSSPAFRMSIGSCHEFLVEENHDIDDFIGSYKYDLDAKYKSVRDWDDDDMDLGWESFMQMNDPVIGQCRIDVGYKYGLIDAQSHSFIKTDEGWRNEEYEVVLLADASLEDVNQMVSEKVRVVPSFTLADFEKAEESGEFFIKDVMVASKNQEGYWIDHGSQRKFFEGELIRLLHHKNDSFVLMGGHTEEQIFHGNVSESNKPESEFKVRKDSSFQGDCVYGTTSVDEAVRVYGNPRSYEIRSKLDRDRDLHNVDPSLSKFGHLYELNTSASLYQASLKPKHISYNDLPSYSSFQLLAKHTGLSEGFASNQWQEMRTAACTLDVYKTISVFCNRARLERADPNIFKQIFGSLGFEGIEINVPSKEVIKGFKSAVNELRELDESEFKDRKVKKESLIKVLDDYVQGIEGCIPPKAQNSHVVVFDQGQVESQHLTILPLHKHFVDKDDAFYSRDKSISLDEVIHMVKQKQNSSEHDQSL